MEHMRTAQNAQFTTSPELLDADRALGVMSSSSQLLCVPPSPLFDRSWFLLRERLGRLRESHGDASAWSLLKDLSSGFLLTVEFSEQQVNLSTALLHFVSKTVPYCCQLLAVVLPLY